MAIRQLLAASVTAVALLLTAGGALLAPAAVASTIYEWTMNGQKFASDRPPPPGAKLIRVQQEHSSQSAAKPAQPPATAAVNSAAANAASDAAAARQVQKDLNKTQSDLCNDARERYQTYLTAQRLFKPGPNQERQYLTDAELTTVRVNAKRDMDTACKSQ